MKAFFTSPASWRSDTSSNKDYFVMETNSLSHDSVTRMCGNIESILPEPRDAAESDFLGTLTPDTYMLGVSDDVTEGDWVYRSSGSPVVWSYWGPGEPNGGSKENCVVMRGRNWVDVYCNGSQLEGEQKSAICQKNQPGRGVCNLNVLYKLLFFHYNLF